MQTSQTDNIQLLLLKAKFFYVSFIFVACQLFNVPLFFLKSNDKQHNFSNLACQLSSQIHYYWEHLKLSIQRSVTLTLALFLPRIMWKWLDVYIFLFVQFQSCSSHLNTFWMQMLAGFNILNDMYMKYGSKSLK